MTDFDYFQGNFIEHGEFRGNLYGTSIAGLTDLVEGGYQPIITPHYQVSKKMLHSKSLVMYSKVLSFVCH